MSSSVEELVKQVELLEDYEEASKALLQIVHRAPATGERLALDLLRSNAGDVHLRAFAFSMLYRANKDTAFEYVRENASTCEARVFGAMLGEIADDVGLFDDSVDLQEMVAHLRSVIFHRHDKEADVVRRGVDEFLKVYGS